MSSGPLPLHSSTIQGKMRRHSRSASWTKTVLIPIPGIRTRRLRILIPYSERLPQFGAPRLGRKRGPLIVCFACMAVILTVVLFSKRLGGSSWREESMTFREPSTLVFRREDLKRIWGWEIASGHYPSRRSIPKQIGFKSPPLNPAIPSQPRTMIPSRYRPPPNVLTTNSDTDTRGAGPKRVYLEFQSHPPNVAYPPRPVPGSVADLDMIVKQCAFSEGKYVRDCLELLRLGGGLDNGKRTRRGKTNDWKYIYLEEANVTELSNDNIQQPNPIHRPIPVATTENGRGIDPDAGLTKKRDAEWESQIVLAPPTKYRPSSSLPAPCDPDNPRLFHMFWTGPFTDKPYMALLSFLFTQNTGIHYHEYPQDSPVCPPVFWMWINPGPAASVPNPDALRDMFNELKLNPWASPFLHPRFKDVIKFKLWNTTEQLDGVPELKDEWRAMRETLFNSGGHVISVPQHKEKEHESHHPSENGTASIASTTSKTPEEEDILGRTGSKSASSYDKLSVVLSDMARFILCHRFGGIYLDADTIFLRDWEELWGWKGAFAYRWSWHEKYNTAVLRMNKGSALGTFLFRTALKNKLDFHPMTVSRYTADAYLEGLLFRLPDAMFDAAWLNTEYYQRERPPQPYFVEFGDFFQTPTQNSAAPQALGFDGFFKGSYSYHFHNFWWQPFDTSRNWPDLGDRFIAGERAARAANSVKDGLRANKDEQDKRDLDWSAVLKRTFESYIREERPNMYGEWIHW